jgi:hypothetical protein
VHVVAERIEDISQLLDAIVAIEALPEASDRLGRSAGP